MQTANYSNKPQRDAFPLLPFHPKKLQSLRWSNIYSYDLNNENHHHCSRRKRQSTPRRETHSLSPSNIQHLKHHLSNCPNQTRFISHVVKVRAIPNRVFSTFRLGLRREISPSIKKPDFPNFVKWGCGMKNGVGDGLRSGRVLENV